MSITACPTTVIAAPAERIWELLISASNLAAWTQTKLIDGPNRLLQVGDHVVYGAGPGMRAVFDILGMEAPRTFTVDVTMTFGIVNHEVIEIRPMDGGGCRVTFN